jgi:hypothetical protein
MVVDQELEQQDLDGVREKPIAAIEKAARAAAAQREVVKKAKEKLETKLLALGTALKEAKKTVYVSAAFNVRLDQKEKVVLKDLSGMNSTDEDE